MTNIAAQIPVGHSSKKAVIHNLRWVILMKMMNLIYLKTELGGFFNF